MAEDLVPEKPMDQTRLVALAREIATDMRELPEVLADFKLSEEQYRKLLENPFFNNTLEACILEWKSAHSVEQRIRYKAAAALEDGLPNLAARMGQQSEPLTAAVETGKLLAKLAQLTEDQRGSNPGEKFTITINLGEDHKLTFEKDVTPTKPLIESAANE